MKTLISAVIRCSLIFVVPTVTHAISAQWDLDPISGDWNTAANWTPDGVPNGPNDTATFGFSNNTNVSISEDTEVNAMVFTPAAKDNYFINVAGFTLTISGVGIINNSPTFEFFSTADLGFGPGELRFTNKSTADRSNVDNRDQGTTNFFDTSSAGTLQIQNHSGGTTNFFDSSTAGSAQIEETFTGGGTTNFFDNSTAGSAVIFIDVGAVSFFQNSTAGNARIVAGEHFSEDDSTVRFADFSTAGNATITLNSSENTSAVFFEDFSEGGTARIQLVSSEFDHPASLDISAHNFPGVTIGSLEGEGDFPGFTPLNNVFLGANNLTVGTNNLSTTFAGVIQDGGQNGGTGGSLTKIGSGTLILSGANTYTGDTDVNRGVLQVDGSITSNTFVNHRGTLGGTGTVNGNVMNQDFGIVRPGGALGSPGVLTVAGNYTQTQFATLMIQIAGANTGDFSVLNVLGNANLSGFLDPMLLNGFVPTIGDTFTFLNYASFTGEFARIKHRVFDNGLLQWAVIYEGNHAILTVEQHVPDQGSTLVLLTLGLLGLMAYRRQLVRGQP